MIVLFDNIVDDSVITSINASLNYPASNLQDSALRKRYQCSTDTDTIAIVFAETLEVSSFWYAFTSATAMELRLYNDSDGLLHTITISDPINIDAYHFNGVDVDYAELDISGAGGVYLGGIGLGVGIEFPDPDNEWEEPFTDNSSAVQSRAGQSKQDYVEPLRVHGWMFRDVVLDDANYYVDLYKATGIGLPIWIDPFENDHSFMEPVYAVMTQPIKKVKDGRNYRFNLNIKEAR